MIRDGYSAKKSIRDLESFVERKPSSFNDKWLYTCSGGEGGGG